MTSGGATDLLRRMRAALEGQLSLHPHTDLRFAVALQTGARALEIEGDPCDGRLRWGSLFAGEARVGRRFKLSMPPEEIPLRPRAAGWPRAFWWALYRSVPLSAAEGGGPDSRPATHAFVTLAEQLGRAYQASLPRLGGAPAPWVSASGTHPYQAAAAWCSAVCMIGLAAGDRALFPVHAHIEEDDAAPRDWPPRELGRFLATFDFDPPPPPGIYLLCPATDARLASVAAIDLLLEGGDGEHGDGGEDLVVVGPDHTHPPIVRGEVGKLLSRERYRVVVELIKAGEAGLTLGQVEDLSPSVHRMLRELQQEWGEDIVERPGKARWGRYRVRGRIRPPG